MSQYDEQDRRDSLPAGVAELEDRVAVLEARIAGPWDELYGPTIEGRLDGLEQTVGDTKWAMGEEWEARIAALRATVARQDAAIRRLVAEQARDRAALLNLSAMLGMSKVDLRQVHDRLHHILHGLTVGAAPVTDPLEALVAPVTDPAPDAGRAWAVDALDFTTFGRDEAGNMARGPLPAPEPMPDCPRCGNNRQVWRNQISGRLRCHRVGCEADVDAPPDAPLPYAVAVALEAIRGEGWDDTADGLESWARAQQQPALPADVREAMWAACYEMRAAANAGCLPLSLADDLSDSAARLRELAGEP